MKRLLSVLVIAPLVLTGCIGILEKEDEIIIVEETEADEQVIISPNLNTPENYYRTVLHEGDYRHSEARGLVPHAINNRIDINQLEIGLMELAQTRFPQDQYFFQEGQYLEGALINRWLRRYDPDSESHREGLNPPLGEGDTAREKHENQPSYLSHIMEHNYLREVDAGTIELGGLVLGISLNSVYYYQTEAYGTVFDYALDEEEIFEEGKRIAIEVLNRVRERDNLANVPIMIALYKEERRQSIVPGTFMALTVIEPGKRIEKWETVSDAHYFFPSRQATTDFREEATRFDNFKQDIDGFFDNYVGIVGRGRYKNNQIQELTIDINLQTNGKAEIIAMTQYVTDRMKKHFPSTLTIQIYLTSLEGPESIIVRHADEEPFVHIFR
ncbi:CamS family sex pheromone protein [Anaerobacillus sp. CMMVII]|uniref:CamS family sex pheromone protein n=1 Tax=Anaerobacillus sp. CMMVII TaxID=2755588 RepID=UPI0021B79E19|nr:CamS family sex pheromone protein [Anaerobacillus sp. CMMVII]MCT8136653.1 CamS family sex pheromone protein [Anaerobacillus sp. CMMVII]